MGADGYTVFARTPMGESVCGSRLDRLAKARSIAGKLRERGITHRQIAREIGVSPALVGRWAKGTVAPSAEQITALQKLLEDRWASDGPTPTRAKAPAWRVAPGGLTGSAK